MIWSKPKYPEFIQAYLRESANALSGVRTLEAARFVSVDVESSGFEVGKDRILSAAVIELSWNEIYPDRCREWLIYQPDVTANRATEIHGILPSETLLGDPERKVLEEIIPKLTGAIIIGHNIWYDALMLNEAFLRNFGIPFRNPTIDVAILAMTELSPFRKSGYINQRPPSIEDLCSHLGIPMHDRHTATGDAYIAAQIFLLLLGQLRQRKGRLHPRDLPIKKKLS